MHKILKLVFAALLLPLAVTAASGEQYPNRPVQFYVAGGPGGTLDIVVRTIADAFTEEFGQPLVIVNKPGAQGLISAGEIMSSHPDGHVIGTITQGALETMRERGTPEYSAKRLRFIAGLATFPLLVLVRKEDNITTLKQLIDREVKNPPNKPGLYGVSNTIGEYSARALLEAAGLNPTKVYYGGKESAMLLDLMIGQIGFVVITAPAAVGHIEAGTFVPLAIAAPSRSPLFPNVPTLDEALLAAGKTPSKPVRESALGVAAPRDIPDAVAHQLERGFNKILQRTDIQEKLRKFTVEPISWDSERFQAYAESN